MKTNRIWTCTSCGVRFRQQWTETTVCVPCRRRRALAYRNKVIGQMPCRQCGRMFDMTQGQAYNFAYGTQSLDYCGRKCFCDATRVWPLNPRGLHYCRAPVPGGCDGVRCPTDKAGFRSPFCYAHKKRKQRGCPIDVHIQRRK